MKASEKTIKELKESLQEERFWAEIVRNASVGIAVGSPDGHLSRCNAAFSRITGYTLDEMKKIKWNEALTPPEWLDLEMEKLQEIHETKKPVVYEKEYIQKNGRTIPIELTVSPGLGEQGEILYYYLFVSDISERKTKENDLKDSRVGYKGLVEEIADLIFELDTNGIINYVSSNVKRLLAYDLKDIVGKRFEEFVYPEDLDIALDGYEKHKKGHTDPIEFRMLTKKGDVKWISILSKYLPGEKLFRGVIRDITTKKEAEEKLQAANQQLVAIEQQLRAANQQLKDSEIELQAKNQLLRDTGGMAGVGGWELDVASNKVTWSEETYKIHEVSMDHQPRVDDAIDFFHPDDRPVLQKALTDAAEKGEAYDLVLRFISAKGKHLITRTICRPEMKDGRVIKLKGTFQDVTNWKKSEEKLQAVNEQLIDREHELRAAKDQAEKNEEYYHSILDNIGDPVFIKDDQSRLQFVNDAFCSLFDLQRSKIIGKTLAEDVAPEERESFLRIDKEVIRSGKENLNEEAITIRGGQTRTISTRKSRHINKGKKILVGIVRDITERKNAEKEIQATNQQLLAANQQLSASEQQLRAGNQKLAASEQQLKAANQQLIATEQQLRAANQQLAASEAELKKTLESLAEKNRRFEEAQEMGKIANYEFDIAKQAYRVSDEGKRIYGYSLDIEDFSFDDVWKCIPDKERLQQAWADLIERDKPFNLEHEIRPVSGPASKIIKAIAEVVKDKSGKPIKVVGLIQDITKRKKAEEALRESERKLLEAQELSHLGNWDYNSENDTVTWSKELYNIFERSYDLPAPKYSDQQLFYTEESFKKLDKALLDCVRHGIPYEIELDIVTASGSKKHVLSKGRAQKNKDNKIIGAVGTALDISDRKKAEEERRKSDERFRIAQDMSPDGFTILQPVRDKQNHIVDFSWIYENKAAANMNGTDPEKVVGQRLLDLFPGHKETQFLKAYKTVAETGEPITFEERYSGETISTITWFRIVVVPMNENIAILAQNITKQKLAEEELENSNELMRYVIEHTNSAVAVHDKDMKYAYVSQNYLDQYKIKDRNVIGKHHYDVFPDLPQKWRDVHKRVLKGEILSAEEDSYEKEDGTVEWTRWECRPWYDAKGDIKGLIVYTEVITEEKKMRDVIKESEIKYRTLFDLVPIGLTASDKQGEIKESNKMAEELLGLSAEEQKKRKIDGNQWRIIRTDGSAFPPEEYASVRALKEKKLVEDIEMGIVKGDNETTWINVSAIPVPEGELGVLIAYKDITEKKKVETEIKAVNYELENTELIAQVGGWSIDMKTMNTHLSKGVREIYQIAPDRILPIEEGIKFYAPEHQSQIENAVQECMQTGKPYDFELKLITAKGENRWVRTGGSAEMENNKIIKLSGYIQDITNRKLAAIALRENQKRLETIFDTIEDMIIEVKDENDAFIINTVNNSFLKNSGLSKSAILDQKVDSVLGNCKSIDSYLKKAVHEQKTINFDCQLVLSGVTRYWEFYASPIFDVENRLSRIVISIRDLTERISKEIAIKNSEEKFRFLSNLASDAVFEYDINSNHIDWYDEFFYLFGYAKDEIEYTADWINNKIHFSDRKRLQESLEAAYNQRKNIWSAESRMQCKDGKYKDVITKAHLFYSADGKPIKALGVIVDYSNKQKAEELRISALVEGADNERKVIARELHDNLGQNLTFVSMLLDQLKTNYESQLIHRASQLLKKTIEETRNLSHLLMPKVVHDYGLKAAILSQIETLQMSKKYDLSTHFNFDGERLATKVENNIYGILQEIITNILKHAKARSIQIQLIKSDNSISLSVEDDGVGFDRDYVLTHGGLGLKNIENRVYLLKGSLIIESAPNNGTFINVDVPLI